MVGTAGLDLGGRKKRRTVEGYCRKGKDRGEGRRERNGDGACRDRFGKEWKVGLLKDSEGEERIEERIGNR